MQSRGSFRTGRSCTRRRRWRRARCCSSSRSSRSRLTSRRSRARTIRGIDQFPIVAARVHLRQVAVRTTPQRRHAIEDRAEEVTFIASILSRNCQHPYPCQSYIKTTRFVPCRPSRKPHHKPSTHRLAAADQSPLSSVVVEPTRNSVISTLYRSLLSQDSRVHSRYCSSQLVQAGTTIEQIINTTVEDTTLPYNLKTEEQAKPIHFCPQPSPVIVIVDHRSVHRQPSQCNRGAGLREEMSVHVQNPGTRGKPKQRNFISHMSYGLTMLLGESHHCFLLWLQVTSLVVIGCGREWVSMLIFLSFHFMRMR